MRFSWATLAAAATSWGALCLALVMVGPAPPHRAPASVPPAPAPSPAEGLELAYDHVGFRSACGGPARPVWSPDGLAVALTASDGSGRLCIVEVPTDLRTFDEVVATVPHSDTPLWELSSVSWAGDGRSVWFTGGVSAGALGYRADRDTARVVPLWPEARSESEVFEADIPHVDPVWVSPDRWAIIVGRGTKAQVLSLDVATGDRTTFNPAVYGLRAGFGRMVWTAAEHDSHQVWVWTPQTGAVPAGSPADDRVEAAFVDEDTLVLHVRAEGGVRRLMTRDIHSGADGVLFLTVARDWTNPPSVAPRGGWAAWQDPWQPHQVHVWSASTERTETVSLQGLNPEDPALAFARGQARLAYTAEDTEGIRHLYVTDITDEIARLR